MSKKSVENSKKYLRILGIVEIALAVLAIISGIVLIASQVSVADLGIDANSLNKLRESGMDDNAIRAVSGAGVIVAGLFQVLVGFLIRRAGVNSKKTTAALVFIVLSIVSAAFSLFSGKFDNASTVISSIANFTVYVLAFMAIMQVRKENE